MGRKKLSDDVRKAHMFRIRMTQSEREKINRAAAVDGEKSSEWARKVLLKSAKRKLS